jgi:hypothetical protein
LHIQHPLKESNNQWPSRRQQDPENKHGLNINYGLWQTPLQSMWSSDLPNAVTVNSNTVQCRDWGVFQLSGSVYQHTMQLLSTTVNTQFIKECCSLQKLIYIRSLNLLNRLKFCKLFQRLQTNLSDVPFHSLNRNIKKDNFPVIWCSSMSL